MLQSYDNTAAFTEVASQRLLKVHARKRIRRYPRISNSIDAPGLPATSGFSVHHPDSRNHDTVDFHFVQGTRNLPQYDLPSRRFVAQNVWCSTII